MLEGLSAEFPSVARWGARLRRPAVARESIWWALLSGLGAGLVAEGVVRIALLVVGPTLLPATEPHPEWLTPFAITSVVGSFVSGAVLMRAAGLPVLLLFVAYELAQLVAAFPSRQELCGSVLLGGGLSRSLDIVCDFPTIVLHRWPQWGALAIGAIAAPTFLVVSASAANWILRAAGAWVLVSTIVGTTLGLAIHNVTTDTMLTSSLLFTVGQFIAGSIAGIIAARGRPAAAVLIALLIAAPVVAYALPQALLSMGQTTNPDYSVTVWLGVASPVVGAASLLAARVLARRHVTGGPGTIS